MSNLVHLKHGSVEYRVIGRKGPAVLVLNGGHTNCNSPFGHEQFFLKQGYRLIIPSRPGYGRTPSTNGRSAEFFAKVLIDLIDYLQLEKVVVVGISGGGPTALQLAGCYPERISNLILQNAVTGGRLSSSRIQLGAYILFNRWVQGWTWRVFRSFAHRFPLQALKVMMGSLSSLNSAQVVAVMSEEQREQALSLVMALQSGSGFLNDYHHTCGELSRISAPTLIIRSRYDGSIDKSHATYALERIAHAHLFESPAESHLLWFSDYNEAIEEEMVQFLEMEGL